MKFRHLFFLSTGLVLLNYARAEAISIVNLGQTPQTIMLDHLGTVKAYNIQPSQTVYIHTYPLRKFKAGEITTTLEPGGAYALWPDGTLALQRNPRFGNSRAFR